MDKSCCVTNRIRVTHTSSYLMSLANTHSWMDKKCTKTNQLLFKTDTSIISKYK